MKDHVLALVAQKPSSREKLNLLREYLQAYCLRLMHDEGVFRSTAFVRGTALRFLHELPRFSEDLDFSLEGTAEYSFASLIKKVHRELAAAGYEVSVSAKDKKPVPSAFFRFGGLLYESGISPMRNQKLSVKIEIDTKPPKGAKLETRIVNKFFPIAFLSYDLASLFSGKCHAILSRRYTKGRDFFDLGWYLSRWKGLTPNLPLLQNALKQTNWAGEMPNQDNWRQILGRRVESADWIQVKRDVENFLERPSDLAILTKENVLRLLVNP